MLDMSGNRARRRRRIWVFVTLLVAVPSVAVYSTTASAAVTTNHVVTSGVAFDQCSDELLDVTTVITFVLGTSTNPTGTYRTLSHATQTGSAVGQTSGNRYEFVSVQTNTEIDFSLVDATRTLTSTLAVVGQGGATNERLHTTFHFTERDGEIVAWVSDISFDCR
jgi:hypothetical protein